MEPEPGQSGGSGSTQIPRLRAAPAPKHCLVPVPYTIQVQGQGTGSNLWEKSMKNAITLCWAFRRSVKCYRYGTIPINWSNTSNRIMFSKKGRKKCTLWRPNPCWAVTPHAIQRQRVRTWVLCTSVSPVFVKSFLWPLAKHFARDKSKREKERTAGRGMPYCLHIHEI